MTKKAAKAPKITAAQRKNWRTLPTADWNVLTFHAFFRDMNADLSPGSEYLPMGNWRLEQSLLKRQLDAHGPEVLRAAFEECFRTYRPTAAYPILTAGFAINYRINTLIPRIKADLSTKLAAEQAEANAPKADYEAVKAWL